MNSSSPTPLAALARHSFSDMGARKWASHQKEMQVKNVGSIDDVWNQIDAGAHGVIPIENSASFFGSVDPHLEKMWQKTYRVRGQVRQTIEMCLTGRGNDVLSQLDETRGRGFTLFTHAKALEQCTERLDAWPLLARQEVASTVAGVDVVAQPDKVHALGLASRSAILSRGLPVLDHEMANLPPTHNKTKLWMVEGGEQVRPDPSCQNHALILIPKNRPNILHEVTGILGKASDLQKIDSFTVDPTHAGFFIPLRKRDDVTDGDFADAMDALYRYPPLVESTFDTLNLLPKKRKLFSPERQKSIVCLGSWSDDEMLEN